MAAAGAVHVDSSNDEQLQAWDGDEGAYWADHADYFDRSAIPTHKRLMAAAAVYRMDPSVTTAKTVVEGFAWSTWDGMRPRSGCTAT